MPVGVASTEMAALSRVLSLNPGYRLLAQRGEISGIPRTEFHLRATGSYFEAVVRPSASADVRFENKRPLVGTSWSAFNNHPADEAFHDLRQTLNGLVSRFKENSDDLQQTLIQAGLMADFRETTDHHVVNRYLEVEGIKARLKTSLPEMVRFLVENNLVIQIQPLEDGRIEFNVIDLNAQSPTRGTSFGSITTKKPNSILGMSMSQWAYGSFTPRHTLVKEHVLKPLDDLARLYDDEDIRDSWVFEELSTQGLIR